MQNRGKVAPGGGWGASTTVADKGTKRDVRSDKRGSKWRPR
jgi:hypothetical protein